jgi:hypothetical protein
MSMSRPGLAVTPGYREKSPLMNRHSLPRHSLIATTLGAAAIVVGPVRASNYDLFHPTPADQLGPMETDRPSRSTSPFTVEPGHVQIETGLVDYSYNRFGSFDTAEVHTVQILPTEVRVGLRDRLEFDAFVQPFIWQQIGFEHSGPTDTESGFGDLQLGLKWTVHDTTNSSDPKAGGYAIALAPFLVVPTATGGQGIGGWAGGLSVPMEFRIPRSRFAVEDTLTVGLIPDQIHFFFDDDNGPHLLLSNAIALTFQQTENLSEFIEFAASKSTESDTHWIGTIDLGATYQFGHDWQVDGAVYFGVSEQAPDVEFAIGLSKRL